MTSAPVILAFDTSGPHCAAVLMRGDAVLAEVAHDMTKGQAERLFPILEALLQEAGVTWAALDRIGVGAGPGNFTGIRIAIAAARGLALSLKIPAIGVSGFAVAAYGQSGPLCATITAPRGQVYHQRWDGPAAQGDPALCPLDALPAEPPHVPLEDVALRERLIRIARIAAMSTTLTAPAPLYVRPADAAPPKDPPPVILPGSPPTTPSGRGTS